MKNEIRDYYCEFVESRAAAVGQLCVLVCVRACVYTRKRGLDFDWRILCGKVVRDCGSGSGRGIEIVVPGVAKLGDGGATHSASVCVPGMRPQLLLQNLTPTPTYLRRCSSLVLHQV